MKTVYQDPHGGVCGVQQLPIRDEPRWDKYASILAWCMTARPLPARVIV